MKDVIIVGFLLDEETDKEQTPLNVLKQGFVCRLTNTGGGISGYVVEVGRNLCYEIDLVKAFSEKEIALSALSTEGVVIPYEVVDLEKTKPGELGYVLDEEGNRKINDKPSTVGIDLKIRLRGTDDGFWKGFVWNTHLGSMRSQCSCLVLPTPPDFFKKQN